MKSLSTVKSLILILLIFNLSLLRCEEPVQESVENNQNKENVVDDESLFYQQLSDLGYQKENQITYDKLLEQLIIKFKIARNNPKLEPFQQTAQKLKNANQQQDLGEFIKLVKGLNEIKQEIDEQKEIDDIVKKQEEAAYRLKSFVDEQLKKSSTCYMLIDYLMKHYSKDIEDIYRNSNHSSKIIKDRIKVDFFEQCQQTLEYKDIRDIIRKLTVKLKVKGDNKELTDYLIFEKEFYQNDSNIKTFFSDREKQDLMTMKVVVEKALPELSGFSDYQKAYEESLKEDNIHEHVINKYTNYFAIIFIFGLVLIILYGFYLVAFKQSDEGQLQQKKKLKQEKNKKN